MRSFVDRRAHPRLVGPQLCLCSKEYLYICDEDQEGFRIINSHHVIVKRKRLRDFVVRCIPIFLMVFICSSLVPMMARGTKFLGMLFICIISATIIHRNTIVQESVVVMPTLGVQLEAYYKSGKVLRRFVPMGKLLAAVINEGVTPFTCYWYLALVVREERKLTVVFQELQPPLNMLVPIWKALCVARGNEKLAKSE